MNQSVCLDDNKGVLPPVRSWSSMEVASVMVFTVIRGMIITIAMLLTFSIHITVTKCIVIIVMLVRIVYIAITGIIELLHCKGRVQGAHQLWHPFSLPGNMDLFREPNASRGKTTLNPKP